MTEHILKFFAYLAVPVASAVAYMSLARRMDIVDRPNQRSSHRSPVVRGGGIVFPLAWLGYSLLNGFAFPLFTTGLALISVVSFIDDLRSLKPAVRFVSHLAAFTLCFLELDVFGSYAPWAVALMYVVGVGALNAINFMDGINGMTGMYALAMLLSLMLPLSGFSWDPGSVLDTPLLPMALAVAVFGWYNFREKAHCFAGDVGSISIGFIMIFLLLSIMTGRESLIGLSLPDRNVFRWEFILFLSVYGVDSVITILHRIRLRENIFEAHRRHLFQYMVNERGLPHLTVAFAYALLQFFIDLAVLGTDVTPSVCLLVLASLSLTYLWMKFLRSVETDATGGPA